MEDLTLQWEDLTLQQQVEVVEMPSIAASYPLPPQNINLPQPPEFLQPPSSCRLPPGSCKKHLARELCEYELLRERNVAHLGELMKASGLFSEEQELVEQRSRRLSKSVEVVQKCPIVMKN